MFPILRVMNALGQDRRFDIQRAGLRGIRAVEFLFPSLFALSTLER